MYHVPNVMFVAIFSNVHFSILGRTLHTAPFQTSPSTKRLARVSSGETMLFDIGNLCYQCCVVLMIILFPVLSIGQRLPMMEGRWRSRKSRSLRWWIARFPLSTGFASFPFLLLILMIRRDWIAWKRSSCCSSSTIQMWSSISPPSSRRTSSTSCSSSLMLATSPAWSNTLRSRSGWFLSGRSGNILSSFAPRSSTCTARGWCTGIWGNWKGKKGADTFLIKKSDLYQTAKHFAKLKIGHTSGKECTTCW